jgi:hypothetical protein
MWHCPMSHLAHSSLLAQLALGNADRLREVHSTL